jgi:outer membrane protein OmpA-like peptidoglycan-associated protein
MSRKRKAPDDSFWSSYADLSTGTMVIFLLLLVSLAVQMRVQQETQSAKVEELSRQVQIILGTRARLADAIRVAVGSTPGVAVDPVTAQLVFAQTDQTIAFPMGSAELDASDREFLQGFVPAYLCALRERECLSAGHTIAQCPRLDPARPQGVRRILVTGHADLLGTGEDNLRLSAARAHAVVNHSLTLIERGEGLSKECQAHRAALWQYAQERFMALGAGDVEHCRQRQDVDASAPCADDPLRTSLARQQAEYRRVTFELELTGADMTGLVLDIIALQEATGSLSSEDDSAQPLLALRDEIAERCWDDPDQYHDCARYIEACLETDSRTDDPTFAEVTGIDCTKVNDESQRPPKLREWVQHRSTRDPEGTP